MDAMPFSNEEVIRWVLWLALAALATNQAVETIHHGSLFVGLRRWARRVADSPLALPEERWVGKLVSCPFCLAHWVAAAIVALVALGRLAGWVFFLPIAWLAVVWLARWLNDVLYPWNRMHGSDDEEEETRQRLDDDEESFHEEVSLVLSAHERDANGNPENG